MGELEGSLEYVLERTGYRNRQFVNRSGPDIPISQRSEIYNADSSRLSLRRTTTKVKTNGTVAESETIIDVNHPAVAQPFPPHEEIIEGVRYAVLPSAFRPKHRPPTQLVRAVRFNHRNFTSSTILTTEGLEAIHEKGVTTLDFKPTNWLFLEDWTGPLIIDFDKTQKLSARDFLSLQQDGTPGFVHPIVEAYLLAPAISMKTTLPVTEATATYGLIRSVDKILLAYGTYTKPFFGLQELAEAYEKDPSFDLRPRHVIEVLDAPRRQRRAFLKATAVAAGAVAFGGLVKVREDHEEKLMHASENIAVPAAAQAPTLQNLRALKKAWSRKIGDLVEEGFYNIEPNQESIVGRVMADGKPINMQIYFAEGNGLTELLFEAAKNDARVLPAAHNAARAQLNALLKDKKNYWDNGDPDWAGKGHSVYATGLWTAYQRTKDPDFLRGILYAAKQIITSSYKAQELMREASKTKPSGLTIPYTNAGTNPKEGILAARDLRGIETVLAAEHARKEAISHPEYQISAELLEDIYLPFAVELCKSVNYLHKDHYVSMSVNLREEKPGRTRFRLGIGQARAALATGTTAQMDSNEELRSLSNALFDKITAHEDRLRYHFNEGPPDAQAEALALYAGARLGRPVHDRIRYILLPTQHEGAPWGGAPLADIQGIWPSLVRPHKELVGGGCHENTTESNSRNVGSTLTDSYLRRALP